MVNKNDQKCYRVLNLIKRVELAHAPLKKWAIIRLLSWQPIAVGIRFEGQCHCKGEFLMSYLHPDYIHSRKLGHEDCGYYCPSCGFSNAGSRKVWRRKFGNSRTSVR